MYHPPNSNKLTKNHQDHQPNSHNAHHHATITPLKDVLSSGEDSTGSKSRKIRNDPIKNVNLFGIDLSHFSPTIQASILIVIILFGFISIGYVEEGFKFEFEEFSFGWFMTAVELFIFSIFAMMERLFKGLASITSAVYLASASTVSLANESERESLIATNGASHSESPPAGAVTTNIHPSNRQTIQRLFGVNWLRVIFEAQMPMRYHLVVAAAMMCSRALTNIALLLLNYPTQVL